MRLLSRCCLKQVANVCRSSRKQNPNVSIRQYMIILTNRRQVVRCPFESPGTVHFYSSNDKKHFITFEEKADAIKDALEYKKEQLKNTGQRIRLKSEEIVKKADNIKDVLEHKKEQLRNTEQRIRLKSEEFVTNIKHQKEITGEKLRERKEHLIQDILETKAKVKERFEGVVEKENILTVPNVLCFTRIVMSPYLGYVIIQSDYNLALGLLVFAGVTDLLDGWIARNYEGQSTKMGSFLDPLADKVLIATLFISLTYQNLIPLSLTLLIVSRDLSLVLAAFVIRYMSLPPPRTMSRYFDVTNATAQLAPTFISKVNTAIQLVFVGTTLASPVFGYVDHPALQALCAATAISTVASAVSYLVSKDTYKFLKNKS